MFSLNLQSFCTVIGTEYCLWSCDQVLSCIALLQESDVLAKQSNEILTAIVHGMRKDEPSDYVRLAATNALLNSLEFTKANFEVEVCIERWKEVAIWILVLELREWILYQWKFDENGWNSWEWVSPKLLNLYCVKIFLMRFICCLVAILSVIGSDWKAYKFGSHIFFEQVHRYGVCCNQNGMHSRLWML